MSFDVGTAVGYLDLDTSGFKRGFKTALSDLETFGNKANSAGDRVYALGSSFQSAGASMTKYVTTPLLGLGAASVTVAAGFESAMSEVQAISGATGKDFEDLTAKAQEMGAKTKFSASESAEAMQYMAMAGWKTEDMLSGIEGIMNLAAASGEDLATTSDIVTDALTAFGLTAADAGQFADVLAAASSNANTNVYMLGESFKYVAPVAGALGYSAEDTAIALGLMANAGIKGSQGGTALRSSLSKLVKPTKEAAKVMDKYGLSLTNSDGSMKSLGEVMGMLRDRMGDLSEAEQAQAAATLFGQEAMSGMLAIINASDGDYEKLTNAIYNSQDAAVNMAETMQDNLGGQLTILKSTLEGISISFGNILLPVVKKVVEGLQNFATWLNNLSEAQKETIVRIAAMVAAIGPLLVVGGKLLQFIGGLPKSLEATKAGFTILKGAITSISAPVVAVIAVIATLVAAFVNLWKNNEEFRNKIIEIWNGITSMFSEFFGQITERINSLGFDFENFAEVLKAVWQGLCDFLAPIFIGVFQFISDTLGVILDAILGIVDFFIAVFTGDWESAWNAVLGIFESIWDGIVKIFQTIGDTLLGILEVVCGWFGTTWEKTWESIKDFFVDTWDSILEALQNSWDWIVGLFNGVADWFYTKVIKPVGDFFTNMWKGFKDGAKAAWDGTKSVFSSVASFFKNIFTTAWEGVKNVFSVGGKIFDGIKDGIVTAFTTVVNTIIKGINKVVSTPFNGLNTILNKLQGISVLGVKPFNWLTWRAPIPQLPLISGSYASGLDYVPRDMLVKVHQGESIRTKQQTREDFSLKRNNPSPRQPLNVTLTLDGRVVGQVAISNINDITDTNGVVPLKI